MVSNFERILDEIRQEANMVAPTYGLKPESVVKLIMDIVDLEDRNRVKAEPRINQRVRMKIEDAARAEGRSEGE